MKKMLLVWGMVCLPVAWAEAPKPKTIFIENATLLTMGKAGVIESGSLLIENGVLKRVGKGGKAPAGAEMIDAKGAFVTPGLFDAHSMLGLVEIDLDQPTNDASEGTAALTPQVFALDAVNPRGKAVEQAREFGITAVLAAPAPRNLVPGQSAILRLRGNLPTDMFLGKGGLHVTLGEASKSGRGGRAPSTRMGAAAMVRQAFLDAKSYEEKWAHYEKEKKKEPKKAKAPGRDLAKDAYMAALRGEIPVIVSAHRLDDIMTALRLAEEFKLRLVLNHATEAYKIAPLLAERNIPIIVGPVRTPPSRPETEGASLENAALLHKAGVKIAFQTDSTHDVRNLPFEAAYAVAHGLPEDAALRALTLGAAEIFGVEKRMGSLEAGKDADVVVWSGHPLEIMSRPTHVFIAGERAFPLAE